MWHGVTHQDNPNETIWFDSVAELAARHDIPVITPEDPNDPAIVAMLAALKPDFLFSFYYRLMLKAPLLALAHRARLEHAWFAAAQVSRPRTGELGDHPRRT
jgi:methionyl-tRNA formyltransferase